MKNTCIIIFYEHFPRRWVELASAYLDQIHTQNPKTPKNQQASLKQITRTQTIIRPSTISIEILLSNTTLTQTHRGIFS